MPVLKVPCLPTGKYFAAAVRILTWYDFSFTVSYKLLKSNDGSDGSLSSSIWLFYLIFFVPAEPPNRNS
jgi:hypothetical protein